MPRSSKKKQVRPTGRLVVSLLAGLAAGLSLTTVAGYALHLTADVTSTCEDSDYGLNYDVFGTVSGDYWGRWYKHADQCVGTTLYENVCRDGVAYQESYMCPEECWDGRCTRRPPTPPPPPPVEPEYCRDTDGGRVYSVRGTLTTTYRGRTYSHTDTCVGNVLHENECQGNNAIQTSKVCEHGCWNGVCENRPADTCGETDNGLDVRQRGTVSGKSAGQSFRHIDVCQDDHRLTEYTCGSDGQKSQLYYCAYACKDGACVDAPAPSTRNTCVDTDGGRFYTARGKISGLRNGRPYSFVDECGPDGDVFEYYCRNNQPVQHWHQCRYGCDRGVCNAPW